MCNKVVTHYLYYAKNYRDKTWIHLITEDYLYLRVIVKRTYYFDKPQDVMPNENMGAGFWDFVARNKA